MVPFPVIHYSNTAVYAKYCYLLNCRDPKCISQELSGILFNTIDTSVNFADSCAQLACCKVSSHVWDSLSGQINILWCCPTLQTTHLSSPSMVGEKFSWPLTSGSICSQASPIEDSKTTNQYQPIICHRGHQECRYRETPASIRIRLCINMTE